MNDCSVFCSAHNVGPSAARETVFAQVDTAHLRYLIKPMYCAPSVRARGALEPKLQSRFAKQKRFEKDLYRFPIPIRTSSTLVSSAVYTHLNETLIPSVLYPQQGCTPKRANLQGKTHSISTCRAESDFFMYRSNRQVYTRTTNVRHFKTVDTTISSIRIHSSPANKMNDLEFKIQGGALHKTRWRFA